LCACSKTANECDEAGTPVRRPGRKTVVVCQREFCCIVGLEITPYRVICQGSPKTMHDSRAEPSCMQELPSEGEGQTRRPRIIKQPYSRRVRSSLWGDMIERNLKFVRFVISTSIRSRYLLFRIKGGKGIELARKASVVSNIIVTGRPSLARKAAKLRRIGQR
jgi:hypothetical protein